MKTTAQRIFTAFLALSLTLPNPAWALRPETDRSGLEEALSPRPSAGSAQNPAGGMEETKWPGLIDPYTLNGFLYKFVWTTNQAVGGSWPDELTLDAMISSLRMAIPDETITEHLGPQGLERWAYLLEHLPFLLTGKLHPLPEATPAGDTLGSYLEFLSSIAAVAALLWKEGGLTPGMTHRQMADAILFRMTSEAFRSGFGPSADDPLTLAVQLAKADLFFSPDLHKRLVHQTIQFLLQNPPAASGQPKENQGGLEEVSNVVAQLREAAPAVPGPAGGEALVFAGAEETGDLIPLAVQQGRTVALLDHGPRAAALEELLRAIPGSDGRYAIGALNASRLLSSLPRQIFIEDTPEGRRKALRVLGLRWDDLPPPVAAGLEAVLAFLDTATEA